MKKLQKKPQLNKHNSSLIRLNRIMIVSWPPILLLTNAVYVKIKKDLAFRTGLIPSLQETITYLTQELNKPYPLPKWVQGRQNGSGHSTGVTRAEQDEQKQALRKQLADAKTDLASAYAQIPRDQQTLAQIKGDVVAFQESKLHDAESALAAAVAGAKLTDAKSSLVAANQHLDECKDQAAKSWLLQNRLWKNIRSATFPSSK